MVKFSRSLWNFLISAMVFCFVSTSTAHASESSSNSKSPVGWADIAKGTSASYAIKEDGTVWGWGGNSRGQIGIDVKEARVKSPVLVRGLNNVIAVAGGDQSLALKKDGTVWAWGNNNIPSPIKGLKDVKQIATGFSSSYVVKQDGTVWAWGLFYGNKPVQITQWEKVASISVGYAEDLLVLMQDGTVWQQGRVSDSKIYGRTIESKKNPEQVKGLPTNIIAVANGAGSYFALQDDGSVWAWGFNQGGQLGDGTNIDRPDPVKIKGITDVIDVKATPGGPLYLKRDGTVWSNGMNKGGQLGIGSYEDKNVPVQVKDIVKIKKIAATGLSYHAMAIREDGVLFSWGNGLVGDGTEWWSTSPAWIKSNDAEAFDADPILVQINGQGVYFDQPPVDVKGRTMVPLRKIFESLGINVTWDSSTSTVKASRGNTQVELTIDNPIAVVNGQQVKLDSPPVVINDRTLVPVRFVAEAFGAKVGWDQTSKTVSVSLEIPKTNGYVPTALTLQLVPFGGLLQEELKPLEQLLGDRLGIPVQISFSTDYLTLVQDMDSKKVDISYLSPNAYIAAHDTFKSVDTLVQAQRPRLDDVTGKPTTELVSSYKSMILVKANSPIQTIADLKGKKFGFQDLYDDEGFLYPGALLTKAGLDLRTDVKGSLIQGYDNAIQALLTGEVDATAVIQDYRTLMVKDYPNIMKDTRILAFTEEIPNDTVAVRSDMDPAWKKKIQDAFIAIGQDPVARLVLLRSFVHFGYTASEDKNFDSTREALKLMGIE